MKLYCSSWGMVNPKSPRESIQKIKEAGFDGIFIDLENYADETFSADRALSSIRGQCDKTGIACDIVRKQSAKTLALMKQGGETDITFSEQKMQDDFCMGDMYLIKNSAIDLNGRYVRGKCSDAMELARYIEELNKAAGCEKYGFCLDIGICNMLRQNIYDFIMDFDSEIKALILRDNDGYSDSALLPYTSVEKGCPHMDWLNLVRGLREIDFDGVLIMDFSHTAAAFPPLLRELLLPMAYSMARYFKWQFSMKTVLKKYHTRVLFGAGNMCRNYMKCYGEEFPPFFTCDNNEKRWGEWFEGLEIKAPEALRELPSDCAIFICNIYYKEIEKQLREMGISNPVEYFNDAYMPSYYFDRLDYWEGKND